eukprot:SAG31_NODE_6353_length_2048_cov_1.257055_2_plen_96_part_00
MCWCRSPNAYDQNGIRNATATDADAAALFHREKIKANHELSVEDYTVRNDSVPATQLGFVPWNTSRVGVDLEHTRFTYDDALAYDAWDRRIQGGC